MTIEQIEEWGSALAKLHLLSNKYQYENEQRKDWKDILEFIRATLEQFSDERYKRSL